MTSNKPLNEVNSLERGDQFVNGLFTLPYDILDIIINNSNFYFSANGVTLIFDAPALIDAFENLMLDSSMSIAEFIKLNYPRYVFKFLEEFVFSTPYVHIGRSAYKKLMNFLEHKSRY